jgi:hypothetical protein
MIRYQLDKDSYATAVAGQFPRWGAIVAHRLPQHARNAWVRQDRAKAATMLCRIHLLPARNGPGLQVCLARLRKEGIAVRQAVTSNPLYDR